MAVKFIRDYRGKLTGERYYQSGQVVSFGDDVEAELITRNAAENYEPPKEEAPKEAPPKSVTKRRSTTAKSKTTRKRKKNSDE